MTNDRKHTSPAFTSAIPSRSSGHSSLSQLALCALACAASACSSESDRTVFEGAAPDSVIEVPVPGPSEAELGGESQAENAAPRLAEVELGIEGDSLVLTIQNRTDVAGSLELSAMIENPSALYLTEAAGSSTLAPGERRRVRLSPAELRGLDLPGSEWTDARVNFDLRLEDGRQVGYPVAVFAEYGVPAAPRAVVSSGKSEGFPELDMPLPALDKQSGTIPVCVVHAVQLEGGTQNNLDFIKTANAQISASGLNLRATPTGSTTAQNFRLDTSGCVLMPKGTSWSIETKLQGTSQADALSWLCGKAGGGIPDKTFSLTIPASPPHSRDRRCHPVRLR